MTPEMARWIESAPAVLRPILRAHVRNFEMRVRCRTLALMSRIDHQLFVTGRKRRPARTDYEAALVEAMDANCTPTCHMPGGFDDEA